MLKTDDMVRMKMESQPCFHLTIPPSPNDDLSSYQNCTSGADQETTQRARRVEEDGESCCREPRFETDNRWSVAACVEGFIGRRVDVLPSRRTNFRISRGRTLKPFKV